MGKLDDLAKALEGAIGGNAESQGVTDYIDTGVPELNRVISGSREGGLPQGRLVEMFGPSSSGKTAIATHFLIQAQKQGGVVGFMDHEKSFAVDLASHMGLNTAFPNWIYKKPRTWEESNTMMAKAAQTIRKAEVIDPRAPILFVFDSIASAIPRSQLEKSMDELNMNDNTALSRITSTTLKVMATFAEEFNFSVLYLNQIRTKPGVVYGDPTTTPGGGAMEFYATTRIALGRKKIMEATKGGKEFVGQEITMKTTKNKLTRPFQEFTWNMMFDELGNARFDVTGALLDGAIRAGKIEQAGARVTWVDGKSYFKKQLIALIDANPDWQVELRSMA